MKAVIHRPNGRKRDAANSPSSPKATHHQVWERAGAGCVSKVTLAIERSRASSVESHAEPVPGSFTLHALYPSHAPRPLQFHVAQPQSIGDHRNRTQAHGRT